MRTFALEWGACGFGVSGGLVPEIRLGWVRLWTCSGSVVSVVARAQAALTAAAAELRK
jgi:hypothetical protein